MQALRIRSLDDEISMKKDEEQKLIAIKTDGDNTQGGNLINRMNPDLKF